MQLAMPDAQITGYMSQPEPDGSVTLHVAGPEGEPFAIRIEPNAVPRLLGLLQRAVIQTSQGSEKEISLQEATMEHIQLGYGGGEVAVLVSTDEIGTIALQGSTEAFRSLSVASQQAAELRSSRSH